MDGKQILQEFKNSLKGYEKYKMEWLIEHGYDVQDICNAHIKYMVYTIEHKVEPIDYSFNQFILENGLNNGERYISFDEWLRSEQGEVLTNIAKNSTPEQVLDSLKTAYSEGMIKEEDLNDLHDKYSKLLRKMKKGKQ